MKINEWFEKIKRNKVVEAIGKVVSSNWFPFITAAFILACYYLSWDIVIMYYVAICTIFIMLFLDDVTPVFTIFVFMNVMISVKNSPTPINGTPSDYYFRVHNLVQIITLVTLMVAGVVYRIVCGVKSKRLKFTPMLVGLMLFSVAMLTNGLFAPDYGILDIFYAVMLVFMFLAIFAACSSNIKVTKTTYERMAFTFLALSILLIIELAVFYITSEGFIVDGVVVRRNSISFGWGIYNTMGLLLALSLPSIFYLASKYKYGCFFFPYAMLIVFAAIMTMSRQGTIASVGIFLVCTVVLLVVDRAHFRNNLIVTIGFALVAGIVAIMIKAPIEKLFSYTSSTTSTLNGREYLWSLSIERFKSAPIFGRGFFQAIDKGEPGYVGLEIIPKMFHNTILHLLATCGAFGLFGYVFHRAQTVISYFKNITWDRTYLVLTVCVILVIGMVDNPLFYVFPTLVYSFIVSVFEQSESQKITPNA